MFALPSFSLLGIIVQYKIIRLDGRYNYRTRFRHLITFTKMPGHSAILEFDRCRRWFNDTYGWSQDVEMQTPMAKAQKSHPEISDVEINRYWAYNIKYNDYRIYVADDQILTMFQLRWA